MQGLEIAEIEGCTCRIKSLSSPAVLSWDSVLAGVEGRKRMREGWSERVQQDDKGREKCTVAEASLGAGKQQQCPGPECVCS